ncbi:MAG TPA: transketolase family protein [Candidatus Omnitrophota bacterium]|nr:transketolase family protein [Candidatus Omnitrophota bacterium]HPT07217.1 transketolase family protein [Candidatus Omnitrophota bacterium]
MPELLFQREEYGKTLAELGKTNKDIVVLDADLSGSTKTSIFAKVFPERFFNFGVAEQNMMATAAGIASCGKTVFLSTFAIFASGRAWDQLRNSVCYNNFDVKVVATHAGVSVGPDGASHQALEDVALTRVIPNINIIIPCDGPQAREAVTVAANTKGPFYIRLGRPKVPTLEGKGDFVFGKAQVLKPGDDVAIIACGIMVLEALNAAQILAAQGIQARVINMHTIRPLDNETIIKAAHETKGLIVAEEHSVIGGLASAVEYVVAEQCPKRVISIGVKGRYGQSGEPAELLKEYHLTADDIVKAARTILG